MPHYKAPDNSLHFIDDDSFAHLLPAGCVPITDSEAEAIYAAVAAAEAKERKPKTVTMRQARLALLQSGLLDAVESAVTGAGKAAQIEWEYSSEVHRDKALVKALTPALGLTEEQLDDLFALAASL